MNTPSLSVGNWLKMAVLRLNGVGNSPQLDAEILLHAATGIHRSRAHAWPEHTLEREQVEDLQVLLERRERGEPIAYITRQQEFWSMSLTVSPAVLIPRPETELLVECALDLVPLEEPARVLDLGTGSGAIAIAIAQARPHAQVLAVDISDAALTVARANQQALGASRLEFILSDWFNAIANERFDVIVSNPPYVAADDPELSPGVRDFEPKIAVIAGPTGLEAIERIVAEAKTHLVPRGGIAIEHGWQQAASVRALLVQAGFSRVRSLRDLSSHERVTEGRL